jgi:predicted outer membrane repeat protein
LGCELLNAPLKDDIEYNLSIYPVTNEGELVAAIEAVPAGGRGVFTVMCGITISSTVRITDNRAITLEAYAGTNRTMRLYRGGAIGDLFELENGSLTLGTGRGKGTLVLDGGGTSGSLVRVGNASGYGNLTLNKGAELRNAAGSGVTVAANGYSAAFTMNGGTISGNRSAGGVMVSSVSSTGSATFTMNGGIISGNEASGSGGGVIVTASSGGTSNFNMTGGTISGNEASSVFGGGVCVQGGTFTMSGGIISGNETSGAFGGGVFTDAATVFNMSGGIISGNRASSGGGSGVYASGAFIMGGGTISGNMAASNGGEVYAANFTMNGGVISGNTASGGGGVYAANFTMNGGVISGNTASGSGGGVCIGGTLGTFTMGGGTISGNTAFTNGGGIYMAGTFNMTGSAVVAPDNPVKLDTGKTIVLSGILSANPAANIDGTGFSPGDPMLTGATANHGRFLVDGAPNKIDSSGNYNP